MTIPTAATKRRAHSWARWLHVYSSMLALVIVLFFGLTGITLNHPSWTLGGSATSSTETGTFPFSAATDDGIDWLAVAEFVRTTYDVRGTVASYHEANGTGTIAFANPGYQAEVFFEIEDNTYTLDIEELGYVAVLNDLHKGRDTGSGFRWAIDVAAGFLVLISVTGLTLQLFLRKRRRTALMVAGAGALATVAALVITAT